MSVAGIALILPMIGQLLGIKDVNQLKQQEYNKLQELASDVYTQWQEQMNRYNYSGANLATGKPDFSWLKRQVYEKHTQQLYDLKKEMEAARKEDSLKASSTGIADNLKNLGNWGLDVGNTIGSAVGSFVSIFDPKTGQYINQKVQSGINDAKDKVTGWGNEKQSEVADKYKRFLKANQLKDKIDKINKQQIASHNSAKRALQDYRKEVNRNGKR